MIRIKIEKITTHMVPETKSYVKSEEVAKDGQGNIVWEEVNEYHSRRGAKFNRIYELRTENREVTDTVELFNQTILDDEKFNLSNVIMAINHIAGGGYPKPVDKP